MLYLFLIFCWIFLSLLSICIGQFDVNIAEILDIFFGINKEENIKSVIFDIRIPRILLSSICGGILAICGLSLQSVFKNPLVGPHIVGVSTAAAFGGALCILFGFSAFFLIGFAFAFGLIALFLLFFLAKFISRSDVFSLILSGIIINGLFSALTSLIQYLADAEDILPNIIYWLLGSFVNANYDKIILLSFISLPCVTLLFLLRWRFNLLSLNDDDLKVMGVNIFFLRSFILVICTILIAAQVSVSGNIGWIGLVIPHIARLIAGSDHIKSIPMSFILGAIFMLIIDDISRSLTNSEIPLGILLALVGSPIFALLLKRSSFGR